MACCSVSSRKNGRRSAMWRCDSSFEPVAARGSPAGRRRSRPGPAPNRRRRRRARPPPRAPGEPSRSTRLRIRNGLRPTATQERQQRQREPAARRGQHGEHDGRHQDGDEGRRHGVGEEVLDQLDVVGGERHQIAGAAAHEIGRRQRVELAEGVDAHLGQQAEGHVVRHPGFQPVQHARRAAPRRRARWQARTARRSSAPARSAPTARRRR